MKRNSVFEELRLNRLEVIQEEICCRAPWRYVMLEYTSDRLQEKEKLCHWHTDGNFEKEVMSELTGVVYMVKRRGPRTSLVECHKNRYGERRNYCHIIRCYGQ